MKKRILVLAVCLVLLIGLLPLGAAAATEGNYLYNGVEFPDINTVWTDKTTYPYAFIYYDGVYTNLNLTTVRPEYSYYNGSIGFYSFNCYYLRYTLGVDCWEYLAGGGSYEAVGCAEENIKEFYWSNCDILSADGSVYFAGSQPVRFGDPSIPVLTTSFDGQVINIDAGSLNFYISATNVNGTLSCQWYINGKAYEEIWNFVQLEEDTWLQGWSYTPLEYGTREIYAVVSNTIGDKVETATTGTVIVNYGVDGSGSGDSTELIDRFDTIDMQLEGIESTVNNIAENVEQLPDQITDGMEQIQEQEKEQASAEGDAGAQEVIEIIPNPSADFLPALENLASVMKYDGTAAVLSLPAVSIPEIAGVIPEIHLMDEQKLNFESFMYLIPDAALTLVRALFDAALVLFCLRELIEMVGAVLTGFQKVKSD